MQWRWTRLFFNERSKHLSPGYLIMKKLSNYKGNSYSQGIYIPQSQCDFPSVPTFFCKLHKIPISFNFKIYFKSDISFHLKLVAISDHHNFLLGYAIFPSHLFWGIKINVRYLFVPHIWSTMNYTYLRCIIWFGHNYITIKPSPHTRWQTSITSESSLIHLYNSLSFLLTPWKICFLTLIVWIC